MRKESADKDLLVLSILTVIAVAVWIAIDVYQALHKSEVAAVLKKQTEPLNPKIDISVLDELEKQTFYDWSEYQVPLPVQPEEALPATEGGEIINP